MPTGNHVHPSDLRGGVRLAIDATVGITGLVEAMHRNIAGASSLIGMAPEGPTGGITGLVYRSIRGVTQMVGDGIDAAFTPLMPLMDQHTSSPERDATLAALNGVMGDHLAETDNPLAISMQLRANGQTLEINRKSLAKAMPTATGKIVLMIHGLCMNDQQWLRQGHDHGAALASDLDYTPIYVRYNSGRHISENGRELAGMLESLASAWPTPIEEIAIIAHSMGGLVARSAYHYAKAAKQRWPKQANRLIFLGTPHHGAPLERGGNWIDTILEFSPYVAPFARLGQIRSAGITDLRHGNLRDEDWQGFDRFKRTGSKPLHLPLAGDVQCFALAATMGQTADDFNDRLLGDGLVPIASALGQHVDKKRDLKIPASRRWVGYELNHMDLLNSPAVYAQIERWLKN